MRLIKIFILLSFLLVSCNQGGGTRTQLSDQLNQSFSNNFPALITPATNCRADRYKLADEDINRSLDLVFVVDSSHSLRDERKRLANSITSLITSLPSNVDLHVGVILAHSGQSQLNGELYQTDDLEPVVLKSSELSMNQIREHLSKKITEPKMDGFGEGEMGLHSLNTAINDKFQKNQSKGIFRESASLSVIFISDENDACTLVSPNEIGYEHKEEQAYNKYCVKDPTNGANKSNSSEVIITPDKIKNRLNEIQNGYPLLVSGVLYNENSTIIPIEGAPKEERGIGKGYLDLIRLVNKGFEIDIDTGDYDKSLSEIGLLAVALKDAQTEFNPDPTKLDRTSITTFVDGVEVSSYYVRDTNTVILNETPWPLAVTDVYYCKDLEPPTLTILSELPSLTNVTSHNLSLMAEDHSDIIIDIYNNDEKKGEVYGELSDFNLELTEGINNIKVVARDEYGNTAQPQHIVVELDTIPPILTELNPADAAIVRFLTFDISGSANESLSSITLNDIELAVSGSSFSGQMSVETEMNHSLTYIAKDLAGNISTTTINIDVILKALEESLITIVKLDNGKLKVVGGKYSTRPNSEVDISGGFFNKGTVTSNPDGSFEFELDFTTQINVSVFDPLLNMDTEATINYSADTTLSGIIKDYQDNALPGVTVTIASSGQSATTNSNGVFEISSPASGDQTLIIDGGGVSEEITGGTKTYGSTSLSVSIGILERNVFQKPIYLVPLIHDGTETTIEGGASTIVTSEHAPGVEIDIPYNGVIFPDGTNSGSISIIEVPSDKISVEVPQFAIPDTVYALEPSGLKFKNRVELTLPNVNDFPEDMELVIMSKNSETGLWEVDGGAKVTGGVIKTKPNLGISHFSEVFAAPFAPTVEKFGGSDEPSKSTFTGHLSRSLTLPSYKSLGQDLAPSLVYNSNWANPSNLFQLTLDIPRKETYYQQGMRVSGSNVLLQQWSWVQPDSVIAQFSMNGEQGDPLEFRGVPNKALISYVREFPTTDSGVYPYVANYEIRLKQMTLTRIRGDSNNYGIRSGFTKKKLQSKLIDQVFPIAKPNYFVLQNKVNSEAGRGWKISGPQKILNHGNRVAIEESNGSVTTYAVDNVITTLISDEGGVDAASFSQYPKISYATESSIKDFDIDLNSMVNELSIESFTGIAGINHSYNWGGKDTDNRYWKQKYSYTIPLAPRSIINLDNGEKYYSVAKHLVYKHDNESASKVAGVSSPLDTFYWFKGYRKVRAPFNAWCLSELGQPCNSDNLLHSYGGWRYKGRSGYYCAYPDSRPLWYDKNRCWSYSYPAGIRLPLDENDCGDDPVCYPGQYLSHGIVPRQGNDNGSLSESKFNNPYQIIPAYSLNALLVADTGNHKIRLINLNNNTVSDFAGNGKTYDNGDGGDKIFASMYHPRGLLYDSLGNLFVSTERGYIRKITPDGKISTFAGKAANQGGVLADVSYADEMLLNNPTGMVIDEDNGFMYVADTGHNRVVRINMATKKAINVAGSGACDQSALAGDGGPAITASLCQPEYVGLDDKNNLLISDVGHKKIRRVTFSSSSTGKTQYLSSTGDNSVLTKNTDGTYLRTYRNGNQVTFSADGLQTSSMDRAGRQSNFIYDNSQRLTHFIDPAGQETIYSYSGNLLSSITDPANRVTQFVHDDGKLVSVLYPDSTTKSFIYNEKGYLLEEYDQRNNKTEFVFNEWNRLSETIRPDNSVLRVDDSGTKSIANRNVDGNYSEFTRLDDPENELYDGITDIKGNETKFSKDINGYVNKITDHEGKVTLIERNLHGDPTKITRDDGQYVQMTYDSKTRDLLTTYDSASNTTISNVYDQYGNVIKKTDAKGNLYQSVYDPVTGLLSQEINPKGYTVSYLYNSLGLPTEISNHLGEKVINTYDSETGNLISKRAPKGEVTLYERDAAGNIIQKTDANEQFYLYSFDSFNRLTSVTTNKGNITLYSYDESGNLTNIKNPYGVNKIFSYDSMNRVSSTEDERGATTSLYYDNVGNVTKEIDPNGNIFHYGYNSKNQLIEKVLPDNRYNMFYDSRNNLQRIESNTSILSYTYKKIDKDYVIDSEASQNDGLENFSIDYSFDANGNITRSESSLGVSSYFYDNLNRLKGLNGISGKNYTFSYDFANRLQKITRPGSYTNIAVDLNGQLQNLLHVKTSGNTLIESRAYTRDNVGNITKLETSNSFTNYGYNTDYELTTVDSSKELGQFKSENFEYDKLGNRTMENLGENLFDSSKQLIKENWKYLFFYDNNGNLTSKQEKGMTGNLTNYNFNSQNQLIEIKEYKLGQLTKKIDYQYDAVGRRVLKQIENLVETSKSFTEKYVYDGQEIIGVYDQDDDLLIKYTQSSIRTDDTLAATYTAKAVTRGLATIAKTYYFAKDHLGSITEVLDGAGNLVQKIDYSSFGIIAKVSDAAGNDITTNPNLKINYGYTNRENDVESSLMYYRARFYMPEIGRFISSDPHPGKIRQPKTFLNKYIYGRNNPMKYVDPNGEFAITLTLVMKALVVLGAVVGGYNNYKEAKDNSDDSGEILQSTILGAITGAAAVALSISNPALAPLFAGAASFVNNIGNQYIFHPDDIDLNRAWLSAIMAAGTAWALGGVLGGPSSILTVKGAEVFGNFGGTMLGMCYDSGIKKGEITVYCGMTFDPDNPDGDGEK